jgi:hypothetical protein
VSNLVCPSTTECVAVDSGGDEVTFNPQSSGAVSPVTLAASVVDLDQLACSSATECVADDGGRELEFDPRAPSVSSPTQVV